MSLCAAIRAATKLGVDVNIKTVAGNSDVCNARSVVLTEFLKAKDYSRLFWIDSDIGFEAIDFLRMLAMSLKYQVVAATYPLKRDQISFVVNGAAPDGQYTINRDGLLKIESAGLGFTVVHREPLEKLAAERPTRVDSVRGETFYDVFHRETAGEDVTFFRDLGKLGYDVWLDPTISLEHIGPKAYKGDVIEALGLSHVYSNPPKE
jgi:hypothetical protein